MIPELSLINSLINLPTVKDTKKQIKNKLKSINYNKKSKVFKFMFNVNNSHVFNHIFALDSKLNQFDLEPFIANIVDFNLIISSLLPVFDFQKSYFKDYKNIQKILFSESLLNIDIEKWFQESVNFESNSIKNLEFIIKNRKVPKQIKAKIISLTHITGQLFETLNINNYQLGHYLMLFYLLSIETKKTMQFKSSTNWNLKSYFPSDEFFCYKLKIIKEFNQVLMELKGTEFNLYWRIINYIITGYYE